MNIDKYCRLPVSFTVNSFVDVEDSRYLAITIDVLHTGLNFNGSIFEKDIVDDNAESIKNTPVLGYIALNPDGDLDFQGHKHKTVKTKDGTKNVYLGSAYGVIPESCNYRWVEKVSSDGVSRDYFQVDALLWTKFDDAVSIFKRDGGKPQSMELELASIQGEEQDDGTFLFKSFKFDGCCLLSSTDESIQPAMIDSCAAPYYSSSEDFAVEMAKEVKEKYEEYQKVIHKQDAQNESEGGTTMGKEPKVNFALNIMEQIDEFRAVLAQKTFVDKWGYRDAQYYLVDIQDDEVIVMDRKDHYRFYGLKFVMEGDAITVDFESASRKKRKYEAFEDGSTEMDTFETALFAVVEHMQGQMDTISTEKDTAVTNFTALKASFDEMKPKFDDYVQKEIECQKEAIEAAKTVEFEKFDEHLSDNADYAALKKDRDNYALDDIQNKCAVWFTEKNLKMNFSKKKGDVSITSEVFEKTPAVEMNPRYGVLPTK